MAELVEMKAALRDSTGSAAARKMRKQELVPAIVYGGNKDAQNISVERKAVWRQLETGHFLSTVYMLDLDGKKVRVIPRDIQLDPVRDFPLHVDFMRVSKSSRIDVEVSVNFVDEDKSPGLKRGGVLNIVRHTIELSCPADAIPRIDRVQPCRPRYRRFHSHFGGDAARQRDADHHRPRLHHRHDCRFFSHET